MRPQGPPLAYSNSDPSSSAQQPGLSAPLHPFSSQSSSINQKSSVGPRPGIAQKQFVAPGAARGPPPGPPPGIRLAPPGTAGPRSLPPGMRPTTPTGSGPLGPPPPTGYQRPPPTQHQGHLAGMRPGIQQSAGAPPPSSFGPTLPLAPTGPHQLHPPAPFSTFPPSQPPAGPPVPPISELSHLSLSQGPPVSASPPTPNVPLPLGPPQLSSGPTPPSWHPGQARRVYPAAYGASQAQSLAPPVPPIGGPVPGGALPGGAPLQAPLTQTATGRGIDPNQIPRPQPPNSPAVFETRVNGLANLPPPAGGQFVVRDTGNCSPRFIRSTLNQVPCTRELLATSSMPLALLIQPMALQDPSEEPLQVVDFGEAGPVRCVRCKGYINPFVRFIEQGRKFICNLCGTSNETPHDYVCNLGPDGRRRDAGERPELSRGSVEFVAPREYMVRDPMPSVLFFLVDVSANAVSTGATSAACQAIQKVLSDIPANDRTFVGFATFHSSIQFYNLNPRLQQPAMMVVPDVQDVYTPLPSDLVVKLCDVKDSLEQLLESIPALFQNSRTADSACVAALQASFLAIKSTGGKILLFQSVLPTVGLGSFSSREVDGRNASSLPDKELLKLLQPADKSLKTMAMEFADFQVCVDVFLTSQGFVDLASLAVFPRTTGGETFSYSPFAAQEDHGKLYNDLRWNLLRPSALEAVMKVRCSAGLSVEEYVGSFHRRLPSEVYLPCVDCSKSVLVALQLDDRLQDNSEVAFQAAILYTTAGGQRRVRVHTLSLPTTSVLANLFRGADLDAQFAFLLKNAAWDALSQPLQSVRDASIQRSVSILFTYRKFCASATSSGQLILPEALKLLPLYTLALNKAAGIRKDSTLDERSYWLSRALALPPSLVVPLVYPRLFPLHTLLSQEEEGSGEGTELPPTLGLSSEKLDQDGVFLLENGQDAFLWFSRGASPHLVHSLLGLQSVEEIQSGPYTLQEFDNPASRKLTSILNLIRAQRSSFLRLLLVRKGDQQETAFIQHLVEDRGQSGMSYVEFLVYVHRQIQNKMS